MATPMHTELVRLRAELAGMRAEHATQQVRIARLERGLRRRVHPRRVRRAAALLLTMALALIPALALADFAFLDLNPSSPHNDNIAAIKAAGITKGCNPPDYTNYCPNAGVTREEMASFLARTAGLGGNPPVANALTAVSATSATHATSADNATTVGGLAPSAFVRVGRAVGTNMNDGIAPANLFAVTAKFPAFVALPGTTVTIDAPGAGFVLVVGTALCNAGSNDACHARLRETTPGASPGIVSPSVNDYATDPHGGGVSPVYIFPVASAGAKSFTLEVAYQTNGATAANGVVTAIFIPFGYNGGATLAP